MIDLGLDTDGIVLNQATVTDSRSYLPRAVKMAAEYTSEGCTYQFSIPFKSVLKYLNRNFDDKKVTGDVEGVVDEKVIVNVDTHESNIGDEYGHNNIVLGHEFWVKNFGGEAVETVEEDTDKFGKPVITVEMFDVLRLTRDLSSQLDNHHYGYMTELYEEYDRDRAAVFSHVMTDPYCLAMLHAERENRRQEEKEDTASDSSNPSIDGVDRHDKVTTKYET